MNKIKIFFCFLLLCLSFYYSKDLLKGVNTSSFVFSGEKDFSLMEIITNTKFNDPVSVLNFDYKSVPNKRIVNNVVMKKDEPVVYIFNTHQTEEYAGNVYNINPTVVTASNILQDELKSFNISSFVEDRDVIKEVKKRKLDYTGTYDVSFDNLKDRKKEYPTLEYFFDIHRDSVTGDASRTKINNKDYATMMFLVGTKNKNYEKNVNNLKIMEKYLNENYSGLVRNTYYQPSSSFYQYYSDRMFLVEIGGPENTLEEVYNTTKALAEAINYYMEA